MRGLTDPADEELRFFVCADETDGVVASESSVPALDGGDGHGATGGIVVFYGDGDAVGVEDGFVDCEGLLWVVVSDGVFCFDDAVGDIAMDEGGNGDLGGGSRRPHRHCEYPSRPSHEMGFAGFEVWDSWRECGGCGSPVGLRAVELRGLN